MNRSIIAGLCAALVLPAVRTAAARDAVDLVKAVFSLPQTGTGNMMVNGAELRRQLADAGYRTAYCLPSCTVTLKRPDGSLWAAGQVQGDGTVVGNSPAFDAAELQGATILVGRGAVIYTLPAAPLVAPGDATLACSEVERTGTIPGDHTRANTKPMVVPTLQRWQGATGMLTLGSTSRIVIEPASAKAAMPVAEAFKRRLELVSRLSLPIVTDQAASLPGDIALSLSPCDNAKPEVGTEGYSLSIDSRVTLRAATPNGLIYATQTLLQMLMLDTAPGTAHSRLARGYSVDAPRYVERGVMLDVGRKFAGKEFLKEYIRFMGWYKLNRLHLGLNNQASKTNGAGPGRNGWDLRAFRLKSDNPDFAGLIPEDGLYYTEGDWAELEQVAASYGVEIVPEFNSPGHAGAFARAWPDIAYAADKSGGTLDPSKPETLARMKAVFREFMPWFRSNRIHIGGDEVEGVPSSSSAAYLNQIGQYLHGYGNSVRMWGDQRYLPTLDEDFVIERWINWGSEAALNWKDKGFTWIESYGDWYIVPYGPSYFNPKGIEGDRLYAKWTQGNPANGPVGGQICVWNDNALKNNYTYEKEVNDLLKDAVPAAGQVFWRGAERDAQGAMVGYPILRGSIGILQYGPEVTMFSGSLIRRD